ncbi:MAG: hypothetical protein M1546_12345 [Chloroflexi bacterium]|nr:hypothetical protein [Chloroflexota bacterium]
MFLTPRSSQKWYQPLVYVVAALITLAVAWVLRPAQIEVVFGNWTPVSFTGTPLVLTTNPEGLAILAAVAASMALPQLFPPSTSPHGRNPGTGQGIVIALLFSALAITALANNLVTLVVGIGLTDFLATLSAILRTRDASRVLRDTLYYGGSGILLLIAMALYGASSNSLYFPLAHIPERLMPVIGAALALRFCLVPLRAAGDLQRETLWTNRASTLAGLVALARLPQLEATPMRAWFYGLALLTAVAALALAILSNRRVNTQGYTTIGALGVTLVSAVSWQSGAIVAAAIAWLLGTSLINIATPAQSPVMRRMAQVARWIGAACLAGLPFTVGFVGRAGVITDWAGRGLGGAALIAGLGLSQALLTLCVLRLAMWRDIPGEESSPPWLTYASIAVTAIVCLHVLVFGIVPGLANAPTVGTLLSRNGLIGWLVWLIATTAGGVAWWLESRWAVYLTRVRPTLVTALSLKWLQNVAAGALGRLANPLGSVFVFLESDGALLWAVIVLLIVILVSRPGGP